MKTSLILLTSLLFIGAVRAADDVVKSNVSKPNIVFILCDDLGYGDVHCLNPQRCKIATPKIDKLAAEGMTFTDAHSSSSVCTPTRYAIMTGRYNWRTKLQSGVLNGYSEPLIAKDRLTVPAMLKQQGYTTACIGKWHLGMGIPKDEPSPVITDGPTKRGFDSFFGISASLDMPPFAFIENDRFTEPLTTTKTWQRSGPAAESFEAIDVLPTLTKKAVEFVAAQAKNDKPFFLYMPLNSPHTPIVPSKAWQGKSSIGAYGDFVMETDWAVGEVLDALDKAGIGDNTLVIFTSDNGCSKAAGIPELQKHGHYPSGDLRGSKADIFDGGHRIPFIARWPGKAKAASRCEQTVLQLDLMATCADIAGFELPENVGEDSVSILPSLYETTEEPLTLNGIHLNATGYRKLADVIAQQLVGKSATAGESMKLVYDAVTDKNWHWHNRYRATDGNDIWGSRSTLSFVDGQTNADVLVHELKMLDLMTANRDVVIWAAASGKSIKPDDTNVPPPIEVKSNVGGGSKSSSSQKEGSSDYLSPEESRKQIKVPEGFELKVFASEVMFPDLANPVQLQVDGKGRLWVASWNSYPKWQPGDELKDSLMIFEDTDRDGVADERKIFAHVHNPLGFEFWGGGVLVTSGPDLLFLKDTDGDDKADVRYPILQGLGTSDTHHAANNLIYGPDGGIYWQSGIFLVHNHETPWKQNLNTGGSGMYRFDPRTFAITPIAANSPNPHGTSFDRWGYLYANDGTGGKSYQVRPKDYGFQMHSLLEKEFRPVPANEILSSAHFPDDMQQDFLVLNVIGFLGVKQYDLNRGDGGKREYGHVWGTPVQELLSGEDRNFRPSDAIVGDDGALYVSDWHNMIIGHMQHNIRDPSRDHLHGRILRLTVKDRPLQEKVAIHGQSIEKLLENLKHPVDGVRHRSRVELSARDSEAVIAEAQAWAKGFDPNDETEAHHLLEALWLHQQHNVTNSELLSKLVNSSVPHAAVAARTVEHFWTKFDTKLATDFAAPPELHIVDYKPPRHLNRELQDSYKRGSEIFQREAHCATCHQTNGQGNGNVYPPLVASPWVTGSEDRVIKLALHGMWGKMQVGGKIYDPSRGVPPMTAFRDLLNDKEMADVLTFVRNTWGNKASPIDAATVATVRAASSDRTTFWKPEELESLHPLEKELMSKEDLNAPVVVNNVELEKELLAASLQDLAIAAEKNGNVQRGKRLLYTSAAACFACHDPPGNAPKLGPDLTKISRPMKPEDWVSGVLYPSRHIEKEFAQVNVLTVEGKVVSGIRVSEDDKGIVLRNVAEPKPITIPADSIESKVESKQSIMPDGLVRSLNNRREFDDLMKYLLSLQPKAPAKSESR